MMGMTGRILLLLTAVLALASCATAFWWGSSEQQTPNTHYFYHKRLLQNQVPYYTVEDRRPSGIPSVPVQVPFQVPLQAQLAPVSNLQNVQLVPCLCPVSQDYPYEQHQPYDNAFLPGQAPQQQQQGNVLQGRPQKK